MKYLIPLLLLVFLQQATLSQTQYQHWQWAKSFGGNGNEQTTNMKLKNGYLYITGTFTSSQINWDGTLISNHGGQDIFIAKLDTLGNTIWVKSFGNAGKDTVKQMEINSNGTIVLLCKSGSAIIQINDGGIIDPGDFFISLDNAGEVTNAVRLPAGPMYTDIETDHEGGVYLAASYTRPFIFKNDFIDTSFGVSGAVILKYNSTGAASWYKNLQVRENKREYFLSEDYFNSYIYPPPPMFEFNKPITGDATARMQIEFDETDSTILAIGNCDFYGIFEGRYSDHYINSARDLHLKTSIDGFTYTNPYFPYDPYFGLEFGSTFSSGVANFEVGKSGYKFQAGTISSLSEMGTRTMAVFKQNAIDRHKMWYWSEIPYGSIPPINTSAGITSSEHGNYLLGASLLYPTSSGEESNTNITVIDTAFKKIRQTHIDEIDRLPKLYPAMKDLSGVFLSGSFADTGLILNKRLAGYEIALSNNGNADIIIGKFDFNGYTLPTTGNIPCQFKTCKAADTLNLYVTIDTAGMASPCTIHWDASPYFSDTTILSPKVYILQDSLVTHLNITDALGMKYSKEFMFTRGRPSDLHLVFDNTNPCANDSVTLRLEGNNFEPCSFIADNWYGLSFPYGNNKFNSPGDVLKYKAVANHSISLAPDWEYSLTSPYCINTATSTAVVVKPSYSFLQTVNVCPGASYTFADNVTVNNITQNFSHIIHYTAISGCDSNYVTNVVVNPVYNIVKNKGVCYGGGYRFPGADTWFYVTADTSYTTHLTSIYGCDSVITINIHPVVSGSATRTVKICNGSSYTFPDNTVLNNVTADTTYTSHIGFSCDSSITIHLVVAPRYHIVQKISVCEGSSYTYPDGYTENNITSFTGHISYLSNIEGCDSIIETFISVKHSSRITANTSVCKGSSFVFPDGTNVDNIAAPLQHISHVPAANGCDSIITTNVSVMSIDTSVTKTNLVLSANENAEGYQWIDCSNNTSITGAVEQYYTVTSVGSYAVAISKQGCVDTSSCYTITAAQVQVGGRQLVNIYPVPSTDHYTISVQSDGPARLDIALLDYTGNKVQQQTVYLSFGQNIIRQNISTLTPGMYTLQLRNSVSGETVVRTIIKM